MYGRKIAINRMPRKLRSVDSETPSPASIPPRVSENCPLAIYLPRCRAGSKRMRPVWQGYEANCLTTSSRFMFERSSNLYTHVGVWGCVCGVIGVVLTVYAPIACTHSREPTTNTLSGVQSQDLLHMYVSYASGKAMHGSGLGILQMAARTFSIFMSGR